MNRIFIPLLLCSIINIFHLNAQSNLPFTSMDVFELEWVTNPQISPDGSQVVYQRRGMDIMKDRRQSRLWLINTDGTQHQKLSSFDVNESNPSWSPDGQRIAFASSTPHGAELFIYWVNTGKTARISQLISSPGAIRWSPDGTHLAFSMFVPKSELKLVKPLKKPEGAKWADPPRITSRFKHERDGAGKMKPGFNHLFVIPSEGGTARQITAGDFQHSRAPTWSKDGKTLFFSANRNKNWEHDFRNSEIYSVNVADGKTQQLTDRNGPDYNISISPQGNRLAYLGFDDQVQTYQNTHLYTMDLDGKNKKMIPNKLDRSFGNPVWDTDGKGIYFSYDDKGNTKIGHTDLSGNTQVIAHNLGGTGIGRPYGGGSYAVSQKGNIVYTHTTPDHPSELAFISAGAKKEKLLMSLNKDLLGHRQLGKCEEIWYTSSFDGRKIQGWIVKPPFFDANKQYPLMVENHGGPISNYGDRFSPEIQLYASAGYVVFYPNPRGSTSYGEEFANLLYHNYPGEDYNDVMDGVDYAIANGIADPEQLYVTGGSAGGIMTAWIIGKNNRFKAAVVAKPVMNWISKTLVADNYYGYANSRYPGQPWENFEGYWNFSPLSLVGNVETPTMVMVGMDDLRTPPSEAKQLYHALKLRKIETVLVEIPEASHGIASRPSNLITKVAHTLAWFEKFRTTKNN